MAKGINRVHLIGNVGQDIDLRKTNNGLAVCNIRMAMTERVKSGDQWVDQTEWIDVVVFGHSAESCAKFMQKGSMCFVEGRLQTRSWEDQQGNKRSKTEVVAKNVQFLDKRENSPQQSNNNYESQQSGGDNPYGGSYNTGGNPYA